MLPWNDFQCFVPLQPNHVFTCSNKVWTTITRLTILHQFFHCINNWRYCTELVEKQRQRQQKDRFNIIFHIFNFSTTSHSQYICETENCSFKTILFLPLYWCRQNIYVPFHPDCICMCILAWNILYGPETYPIYVSYVFVVSPGWVSTQFSLGQSHLLWAPLRGVAGFSVPQSGHCPAISNEPSPPLSGAVQEGMSQVTPLSGVTQTSTSWWLMVCSCELQIGSSVQKKVKE